MEQTCTHTLLLVDDEAAILRALNRLLRQDRYRILTAESGPQALDLLRDTEPAVSLIISDQRMPGMSGADFLERSMDICPEAIRFLLTGYSDMQSVVEAVNKGRVHNYLNKPWDNAQIIQLIREALDQVELRRENRRLSQLTQRQNQELAELNRCLEDKVAERTWALKYQNKVLEKLNSDLQNSLTQTVRLLLSLVESSNVKLGGYLKAVGQVSRRIAASAGLDEKAQNRVEMAGLVHDIGLLGMPERILTKDERSMSADELEIYIQHPEIAALSLSAVAGLKDVSEIVRAHHENVDGSGFPRRIMAEALPTETQILAVAADFCAVQHLWPQGIKQLFARARRYLDQNTLSSVEIDDEAVMRTALAEKIIIQGIGKRYDGKIVQHLLKSIDGDPNRKTINHLTFNMLKKGMVLKEDLRLKDGRLLLTQGTTLDERTLQSIQTIGNRGMIEQSIAVSLWGVDGDSENRP